MFRKPFLLVCLSAFTVVAMADPPLEAASKSRRTKGARKSSRSKRAAVRPLRQPPMTERELEEFVERCKAKGIDYKLSLKQIAQEYTDAKLNGRKIPDRVKYLHGFTWFFGYAIDRDKNDIILLGMKDKQRPKINLDCLVTGLRAAYASITPGCSLDPHPSPKFQKSRVDGIPWQTRWAEIMIKADYDMKLISQGKRKSGVKMRSVWARWLRLAKRTPPTAGPSRLTPPSRFWFNRPYQEVPRTLRLGDGDIVLLYKNPVVLMTEMQVAGAYGTGIQDRDSLGFANTFTRKMVPISRRHRSIAQLLALYRLLDLMAHLKQANATVPEVPFWVETYSPPYKGPPKRMKTSTRRTRWTEGSWNRRFKVFGGVRMPLNVDPKLFKQAEAKPTLKKAILSD